MPWYVDAMSELVTNPYSCIFCEWEVMSGSPMGRDTPLSVCDCCLWRLLWDVNHGQLHRCSVSCVGLLSGGGRDRPGSPMWRPDVTWSPVSWSSSPSEPRPSLVRYIIWCSATYVSFSCCSCQGISYRWDAVCVCEFSGVLYAYLRPNSMSLSTSNYYFLSWVNQGQSLTFVDPVGR